MTDKVEPLTADQVVAGLQYIADSPPRENGGFHPATVETVKAALATIAARDAEIGWLKAANAAFKGMEAERDRLRAEVERLEDCTVDAEQHRQMREERDALREQKARLREALELHHVRCLCGRCGEVYRQCLVCGGYGHYQNAGAGCTNEPMSHESDCILAATADAEPKP